MAKTSEIKTYLKELFPLRYFSVVKGQGTASGWVTITVKAQEWLPKDTDRRTGEGRKLMSEFSNLIDMALVNKAKEFEIDFYYPDDGWANSKNSCINIIFK